MTEQTLRVLIVCADAERRESIAQSLNGGGPYSVRRADGVRQALELLSGTAGASPDFVVIDANLASNGDGEPIRDLIERAAARRPTAHVILLTDVNAPVGQQAWFEDFQPPVIVCSTTAELAAHVHRLLEGQRPSPSLPSRPALDVLIRTNEALHAPPEEGEVLRRILEGVQAVGFDRARLYIMSDEGSEMSVAAHVGMPESFAGTPLLLCSASLRTFFTTPEPQLVRAGADGPLGFEHFLEAEGTREWVCTPLLQKNQLIGIISADTGESGRALTEEDLLTLPLFAAQARTALELNLISEIEKQVQTLQSVLKIYCSISSTLRLDNILSTACSCTLQLVHADQCWLMLFEEGFEKGRLRACSPKGLLVPGSEISLAGSSIKDTLVVAKSPLVVTCLDDGGEQGDGLGELGKLLRESDVRSCLMVPVISKGLVLGAFGLDSIGHTRTFSQDEIVLCQVFAAQLAVAMENANLYSATVSQARQLESLRQMTMAITSAQCRDELLRMIIQDAKRLLNGESCAIYECDEQGVRKLIAGRERGAGEGAEATPGAFLEVRLRLKNQTVGFLRINAKSDRRFTLDEKRILGLFADQAAIAIEKTKLLELLNEQRNLRDSLVANMPNGIIAVDADGRVVLANPPAWKILGYEAGDVLPTDVNQVYYDPDEGCIINEKLAAAEGKGMQYSTFARAKDGSPIPIRLYVSALMGANNERKGSVGYFEDLRCDDRTELLLEACGAVAQADTVHNGLQLLARMLLRLLSAAFCRILLLDDSGRYLTIDAAESTTRDGKPLDWEDRFGQRLKIDEYEGLRKILEGSKAKVLRLRNTESKPWLERYSEWINLKSPVQSLLLVPLKVGETVVGLLSIGELRKEERSPFTSDKSDLASKIAGQVAALIDRRRLQEADGRRNQLLKAMTERAPHIRGDKETKKLMQEFVRLAMEIVGYTAAGLYTYRSKQDTLERAFIYPAAAAFTEKHLAQVEEFAKRTAHERESIAVNECSDLTSRAALLRNGIKGVLFVPLKLSTGEVEAVLFAVNDEARPRFAELELDALNHFTELTSSALQTSRSMDLNQRMLGQLGLLHQLSDYAQEKQDVSRARDALLTCITGGYGLGFNRAVIIEREGNALRGVCGIGHVKSENAHEAWDADHKNDLYNFASYVDALDAGVTFSTPIGDSIRGFHSAVPEAGGDVFSEVLRERKPRTLKVGELNELPDSFLELFQPETDVVLIPFVARGQAKGIIVADNKFTQGLITNDDIESLLTFANTVATAIDNIELFGRVQAGRQRLEHLQGAVESMARSSDTVEVLHQIVDRARVVLNAHSAALWRFDSTRDCFFHEGYVASNIPNELIVEFIKTEPRPGGTAYTVMEKGWLEVEAIADEGRYEFLGGSTRGLLSKLGVSSFIGLALVEGDDHLGVLYVNYDHPLRLSEDEQRVAQTFANYAAIALKQATLADQKGKAFGQLNRAHAAAREVAQMTTLGEPRESLRSVVTGTKEALNCDAVTLYTYDDDRKVFDYPPEMIGVVDEDAVTKLGRVTEESVVRVVLNLDTLYVAQDAPSDELLGKAFARREGVNSSVATRLMALGRPVGVMFVNFRTPHEFTEHELTSIDLFAKQAAVAIYNKQLYEQQKKRAERLQILHEAGRDITSSLNLKETLGRIARQASRLASHKNKDANFVDIKLIDGTKVRLAAAFPEGEEKRIHELLGKEIDLNVGVGGRIGIIGRAIKEGKSLYVGDVLTDPDYLGIDEETRSQIVVLIKKGENVIGVISAEHPYFDAFDEETLQTMESLAAQASIAIENAKHFDQLTQAKTQVDAQTSLALLSMASTIWRHDITGSAAKIVAALESLHRDLPGDFPQAQRERLEEMRKHADSIHEQPVAIPISPENAEALAINEWVRKRLNVLRPYYHTVEFLPELSKDDSLSVRIHKEWLRPVFDIPVDNAVKAMTTCDTKCLLVTTGLRDGWVEITLTDTGVGIPTEERSFLTKTRIVKPQNEKRLGTGLLMARTILKAYGGDIEVSKTSPEGTTMLIRLPAAS